MADKSDLEGLKAGEAIDAVVSRLKSAARTIPDPKVESSHSWPSHDAPRTKELAERIFPVSCARCEDAKWLSYPVFEQGTWNTRAARCSCVRGKIDEAVANKAWKFDGTIPAWYDELPFARTWHTQRWLSIELERLKGRLNPLQIEKFRELTEELRGTP